MATFTLNSSLLSGEQFKVLPFDLDGEFRDVQLHFYQSGASEDLEIHYLELHYTIGGVSHEDL